jgi:hypothetical protein
MAEKGLFSNDDDDDVRGHQKVVVMDWKARGNNTVKAQ